MINAIFSQVHPQCLVISKNGKSLGKLREVFERPKRKKEKKKRKKKKKSYENDAMHKGEYGGKKKK